MLDDGHYSLVKSYTRLLSMRSGSMGEKRNERCKTCPNCLTDYYSAELFKKHIEERHCVKMREGRRVQKCVLPQERDKNGFKPCVRYKPSSELALHPCVVYADFEVFSKPSENELQQETVASYAYHTVGRCFTPSNDHIYRLRRCDSLDDDVAVDMIKALFDLYGEFVSAPSLPLAMTEEDNRDFAEAEECHYCKRTFKKDKVRDHNHLTGRYRCAACNYCNMQVKLPNFIPILFHNMEGYDGKFILHALTRFKQKYGDQTVRVFREGPRQERLIRKMTISVIARTSERNMKIQFGPLRFIDSFKFQATSLGSLITAQRKMHADIRRCFPILTHHHPFMQDLEDEQIAILLDGKMRMPFEAMIGPECFALPALFPKEAYNSQLSKDISDDDYGVIARNVRTLGLRTFGDYHDCYLYGDLVLADVMESFRAAFFEKFGVDIVHNVSMPSAAWHAMLHCTNVRLDLIPDTPQGHLLYNDVKNNIRGGMSCVFQPYAKTKPGESIIYVDAVSLYPTMMLKDLPVGGFKLVPTDHFDRLIKCRIPCMFIVDLDVPRSKHDFLDWAPACAMAVPDDEISRFTKGLGKRTMTRKLVPWLGKQTEVGIHTELLSLYLELGIRVTKVHRIWTWRSRPFMRDWIQGLADERARSTDEATRQVIKITMNSVYGKTCENKEGRTRCKLETIHKKFLKDVGRWSCTDFDVISDEPFLGMTKQIIEKGIVLDSPRIVGWCILELSKAHMMRAYYMGIRKIWHKPQLLMTDTDSLIIKVKDSDPLRTMREADNPHCVFDVDKKKELGLFGIETVSICEFVGHRAKMYSYKEHSGKTDARIKGIPSRVRPGFDDYKSILFNPRPHSLQFSQIVSKHHHLSIRRVSKKALSIQNDKVYQLSNLRSRPLGHYRNQERFAWIRKRLNKRLKRRNRLRRPSTIESEDSEASTTLPGSQDALSPRSDSS